MIYLEKKLFTYVIFVSMCEQSMNQKKFSYNRLLCLELETLLYTANIHIIKL